MDLRPNLSLVKGEGAQSKKPTAEQRRQEVEQELDRLLASVMDHHDLVTIKQAVFWQDDGAVWTDTVTAFHEFVESCQPSAEERERWIAIRARALLRDVPERRAT